METYTLLINTYTKRFVNPYYPSRLLPCSQIPILYAGNSYDLQLTLLNEDLTPYHIPDNEQIIFAGDVNRTYSDLLMIYASDDAITVTDPDEGKLTVHIECTSPAFIEKAGCDMIVSLTIGSNTLLDDRLFARRGSYVPDIPIGQIDYNGLYNKPQINSITLYGNKTSAELGLMDGTINEGQSGQVIYRTSDGNVWRDSLQIKDIEATNFTPEDRTWYNYTPAEGDELTFTNTEACSFYLLIKMPDPVVTFRITNTVLWVTDIPDMAAGTDTALSVIFADGVYRIGSVEYHRGSSGVTDYDLLENKPYINGVELMGDRSAHELNLATPEDIPEQVQANWAETDTSSKSYIQNKPDIPTTPADIGAIKNMTVETLPSAATVNISSNMTTYLLTPWENVTINLPSPGPNQFYFWLYITMSSVVYTVTFPNNISWESESAPLISEANTRYRLAFMWDVPSQKWIANQFWEPESIS